MGWSPRLKKNVYVDDSTDYAIISELKRLREVDMVIAYDQSRDRTIFIELKESEKEGFDDVYSRYTESGGQILYSRKKQGRSAHNVFDLDETPRQKSEPDVPDKKSILFR